LNRTVDIFESTVCRKPAVIGCNEPQNLTKCHKEFTKFFVWKMRSSVIMRAQEVIIEWIALFVELVLYRIICAVY